MEKLCVSTMNPLKIQYEGSFLRTFITDNNKGLFDGQNILYWDDAQNNTRLLDDFPARSVAWVQTCRF